MKKLSIVLIVIVLFQSCKKDEVIIEPSQFADIEDIVSSFQGDRESDIVIVNTQGGPITTAADGFVTDIMKGTKTENVLWVNVHQVQTLSPEKFNTEDISFEQAKTYDAESIANLKKVVTFFKEELHKKVYVLGISFGAFMTQELIAKHGIDVADKYYIMVGRLNIDEKLWKGFSNGQGGDYTYDANGNFSITLKDQNTIEDRNMSKLAAGLGHKRYMNEWSAISSLSKVTYLFGDRDEQVGGLIKDEATFLVDKGAKVLFVEGANHSDAIDAGIKELKTVFEIN